MSLRQLVSGVIEHLNTFTAITSVIGATEGSAWILPSMESPRIMFETVGGSSSAAVVISHAGTWSVSDGLAMYPRILVETWADPDRDSGGNISDYLSAERRAITIAEIVDSHIAGPANEGMTWGSVWVAKSQRISGIEAVRGFPSGDGLAIASSHYALTIG